jgi:organic radical activating enzyme
MHLNLFVSQKCFLYCKGCYSFSRIEKFGQTLETQKIIDFLEYAYDYGIEKVTLCGGDPLVRSDIIDLLKMIKNIGYYISIDTIGTSIIRDVIKNDGTIIKQIDAKVLSELVDEIGLPIDGSNNEIFRKFRQTDFDLLSDQLEICDELKKYNINICINTVVHKGNLDDTKLLCDIVNKLDYIKKWQLFKYAPMGKYGVLNREQFEISEKQFEEYMGGIRIQNYPNDILAPGASSLPATYPKYLTKWLEFRAKVIYDFMQKARTAVKGVKPGIKFGVYVGGWYSTYYDVGVNWAASTYDTSRYYNWATSKYKNYGYAACMDQILIGAYASPLKVHGTTEWTMEGFCSLAKDKIKGECPIVAGGPDVGNWDTNNQATQEQENQAIVQSVKACMNVCDGYFLFDMIHLKKADQWQYAKEGIKLAIE